MKKIIAGAILAVTLIVGFAVNNNQYEYKVTSETKEFIIGDSMSHFSKDNEGVFLVKNEATNNIKIGDIIIVKYGNDNHIKDVRIK